MIWFRTKSSIFLTVKQDKTRQTLTSTRSPPTRINCTTQKPTIKITTEETTKKATEEPIEEPIEEPTKEPGKTEQSNLTDETVETEKSTKALDTATIIFIGIISSFIGSFALLKKSKSKSNQETWLGQISPEEICCHSIC